MKPEDRKKPHRATSEIPIIASGFEYVTEKNGIMLFRKPKRLVSLDM